MPSLFWTIFGILLCIVLTLTVVIGVRTSRDHQRRRAAALQSAQSLQRALNESLAQVAQAANQLQTLALRELAELRCAPAPATALPSAVQQAERYLEQGITWVADNPWAQKAVMFLWQSGDDRDGSDTSPDGDATDDTSTDENEGNLNASSTNDQQLASSPHAKHPKSVFSLRRFIQALHFTTEHFQDIIRLFNATLRTTETGSLRLIRSLWYETDQQLWLADAQDAFNFATTGTTVDPQVVSATQAVASLRMLMDTLANPHANMATVRGSKSQIKAMQPYVLTLAKLKVKILERCRTVGKIRLETEKKIANDLSKAIVRERTEDLSLFIAQSMMMILLLPFTGGAYGKKTGEFIHEHLRPLDHLMNFYHYFRASKFKPVVMIRDRVDQQLTTWMHSFIEAQVYQELSKYSNRPKELIAQLLLLELRQQPKTDAVKLLQLGAPM